MCQGGRVLAAQEAQALRLKPEELAQRREATLVQLEVALQRLESLVDPTDPRLERADLRRDG